jgi:hypothetical protein
VEAYYRYFCGNTVEEKQFTERCDFGAGANIPRYTCCTKSCHWAGPKVKCAKSFNNCWKKGRCTGKSSCRDSTPKPRGTGCNRGRGRCDGLGNCQPKTTRRRSLRRRRGLKTRKNMDLAGFSNFSFVYPDDATDGYWEELEQIIQQERHLFDDADEEPLSSL